MKIIKIIKTCREGMNEETIKNFLYKNLPKEMINGLEYDDPKTIERVLKLLGIDYKKVEDLGEGANHSNPELDEAAAS